MVAPTAETDNSRQNKKSRTLEDIAFLECAGFSFESGTSAFHGSCRTSTAKLRSRVCPRGESVIRDRFQSWLSLFSFDFSSRSTSTMRKRETGNQSRSASALAFLSPRNTIGGIFDFTRFLKKVFKETLIQSLPACVSFLTDQR